MGTSETLEVAGGQGLSRLYLILLSAGHTALTAAATSRESKIPAGDFGRFLKVPAETSLMCHGYRPDSFSSGFF